MCCIWVLKVEGSHPYAFRFGDAVLKMIQTESLLKSTELRDWLKFLHEGDLSTIRQGKRKMFRTTWTADVG